MGLTYCLTCPNGKYVDRTSYTCMSCAPGTYMNTGVYYNADGHYTYCLSCAAGLIAPSSGMSACVPCAESNTFSSLDRIQCVCNAGFYRNSSNSCQGCSKGWYKSAIGDYACYYCIEGFYSSAIMQTTCQNCDPGYYTNLTSQTVCIGCAPGTRAFSTGCEDCWPGSYSTGTQWGCRMCAPGTFSNASKATFCYNCSLGYYSTGIECIACDKGRYASSLASVCILCASGTYANVTGMSFCWTCPKNSYVVNNSVCSTCPIGQYVMNDRNPELIYCAPCTAGMYDDFVNTSTCTACPMGMFSTGSSMSTCQSCEVGQFSFQAGLTMCMDCPWGTYSTEVILAPNLYQSCQYQWDIYLGTYLVCDFAYNPVQSLNNWYEIRLDPFKSVKSITFYEEGYCVYSPLVRVFLSNIPLTRNISFQLETNAVYYECKGFASLLDVKCPYTFFCPTETVKNMSWLYIVNVPTPRTVILNMDVMKAREQAWMSTAPLSNASSSRLVLVLRDYQKKYNNGDFFYVDVYFYKSDARFGRITRFSVGVTMISPVGLLEYVSTQFNVSWGFKVIGLENVYIQYVCENSETFQSGRVLFTMKFKVVKISRLIMQQGVFCVTPGWRIQENGVNMVDQYPDAAIYVLGYSDDLSSTQGNRSCLYIQTKYDVPAISVVPVPTQWGVLIEKVYPFRILSPLQRFTLAFRSINIDPGFHVVMALIVFRMVESEYFTVDMNSATTLFPLKTTVDNMYSVYSFLMYNRGFLQTKLVNYTDNTSTVSWVFDDIVNRHDLLLLDIIVNDYVPEERLYTVFCMIGSSLTAEMEFEIPIMSNDIYWVQGYVFDSDGCLRVYVSASKELVQKPLKIAVQGNTCSMCPVGTYGNGTKQTSCLPCKQCSSNQYFSGLCSIITDSACSNITQCQAGYGVLIPADKGNFTRLGSDAVCAKCCPNGFWYSAGSSSSCGTLNNFTQCQRCSPCYHGYVKRCSLFQDSVCSPKPSFECVAFAGYDVPSWILENPALRCRKGQYIQNFSKGAVVCDDCSGDYIGVNGMYCQPCLGYRLAYWDHSMCVCRLPTVQDFNTGDCVCPAGYYIGYFDGCQICPKNTYKPTSVILNTDWYNQASANGCLTCEEGKYASVGQTVCQDCPAFHYRLHGMEDCVKCGPGLYAPFKNFSFCARCVSRCTAGYYSDPCPTLDVGTFSNFICRDCTGLPNHGHWVEMDALSPVFQCIWACDEGYYRGINECKPCSSAISCEPGKQVLACTDIEDMSCEWDCVNDTKPMFHSEWVKGCDWGCKDGYRMQKMDYGMFSTYECIWNETQQVFWHW